jgi:uncharacterized membrane protein
MRQGARDPFFVKPLRADVRDFEDLILRDYDVAVSSWISAGWEAFKKNAGLSIAFAVLAGGVCLVISQIIPGSGMLLYYPLAAGVLIVALKTFRGEPTDMQHYLLGLRFFLPLLVLGLVSGLFIAIGLFFLVIPGLYLGLAYVFAPCLIVDRQIDFWPAMEISRRKVNRRIFGMAGFGAVLIAINLAGCIPMFLGLFVTVPLSLHIIAAAYRDVCEAAPKVLANDEFASPPR